MNLSGLENPVRQNTTVVLQCVAQQAKPAAVLTWYNASRRLDEKENQISQTTETNAVSARAFFEIKSAAPIACAAAYKSVERRKPT